MPYSYGHEPSLLDEILAGIAIILFILIIITLLITLGTNIK